jgi:hypothetical protein
MFIKCNADKQLGKLKLQEEIKESINYGKGNKSTIIYYHSGDCSYCYGVLTAITMNFPEIPIISISANRNKPIIDFYLERIQFKGTSFIDSDSLFYLQNREQLKTKNLFLIDKQGNILAESWEFDDKTKVEISCIIKNQ